MTNRREDRRFSACGFRLVAAVAVILSVFSLFAERQPYERYQSVVDRQMFGEPPPGFDPTKNPSEVSAKDERAKNQELTKEQEQVKSAIHFSMVNVTPAGDTAVGFTDNSDSKNPRHYYLKVGESRDGWMVKEADALAATMTIAKGEIEVSLTLGGDSSSGGGTKRVESSNGRQKAGASAFGSRTADTSGSPLRGLASLRERREARKAKEDARLAEEKSRREEESRQRREEFAAFAASIREERAQEKAEREERERKLAEREKNLEAREKKAEEDAEKRQNGDDNKGNSEDEV